MHGHMNVKFLFTMIKAFLVIHIVWDIMYLLYCKSLVVKRLALTMYQLNMERCRCAIEWT